MEESFGIVILGASGDLAKRKLIPSLLRLCKNGELPENTRIIGSGRTPFSHKEFREHFDAPEAFRQMLYYYQGMDGLKGFLDSLGNFDTYIVFMALPPKVYLSTAESLYEAGFQDDTRLIIEKPFGYDYETAVELNSGLAAYFDESQIYRIDHYLAKEAVQNILVFRFANSIFYPVWNGNYVESIQINAIEDLRVDKRAQYFDTAGIIRDMVQNHLFQLLSLLTMEAPVSLAPEDIQAQKLNLLKSISVESCRRYQYEGYQNEDGIAPDSTTETYVELKLHINNFRWTGMPVYIRTGKALHRKGTEIGLKFKKLPKLLYNENGDVGQNAIIFKVQPSEGIIVDLSSKLPGSDLRLTGTNMKFCYHDSFSGEVPAAYQKLLLDAIRGDKTLFVSAPETELAWQKIGPFLDRGTPEVYKPGAYPQSAFDVKWIDFDSYGSACD